MAENDSTPQEKQCSCCKELKPVGCFFKCAACKDGLRGECKACVKAKQEKYYAENRARILQQKREYLVEHKDAISASRKLKYAANPGPAKERTREHRLRNVDAYREAKKARYYLRRDVELQRARRWREANREAVRQYMRAHSSTPEAKEKRRIYTAANREAIQSMARMWNRRNKDKIKPMSREYRSAWNERNKNKLRVYQANRRARSQTTGKLSQGLANRLLRLQRGKCACCGKELGSDYHMDHIIPLARGGANTDDNIQLLRAACNLQKNAKHPIDFMQERGYLL